MPSVIASTTPTRMRVMAMNSMRSFFSKAYAPVNSVGLGTRTPYSNISSR